MTTTGHIVVGNYTNKKGETTLAAIQGSCSDGTYAYVIKTDPADDVPTATETDDNAPDQSRIIKIDLKTGAVVQVGPVISVAHANDLTYNPNTKKIYVAWCSGNAKRYSIINPSTLDVEKYASIGRNFFSMAYDYGFNRYAFAKSQQGFNNYGMMVYDGNFNFVSEFETERFGYTAQGIFCDAEYIYYAQSCRKNLGTTGSIITVHTWDGELVCVMRIDNSDEIESIFWCNGAFYACYNGSSNDYVAKLVVKS